jgi:hypothetical protein
MNSTKDVATMPLKLTKLAIIRKLNDPRCVVECDAPMLGLPYWRRIAAVRFNEPGFSGLWVQEYGGLGAWYSPAQARWRLLQEGEKSLGGKR